MEKKFRARKKWVALILAAVVAASLLTSTYLWFSSTGSLENVFDMETMDIHITENFNPKIPVEPDTKIKKEVAVENRGDGEVLVRMKLEESLQLMTVGADGNLEIGFNPTAAVGANEIMVKTSQNQIDGLKASGFVDVTADTITAGDLPSGTTIVVLKREQEKPDNSGTKIEYFAYDSTDNRLMEYDPAAVPKLGYAVYTKDGGVIIGNHGEAGQDLPSPHHDFINLNLTNSTKWKVDPSTGWYYYTEVLAGHSMTDYLVDSVEFDSSMGNTYKGAIYTLTPTYEAVQVKQKAVEETWLDAAPFYKYDDTTKQIVFTP